MGLFENFLGKNGKKIANAAISGNPLPLITELANSAIEANSMDSTRKTESSNYSDNQQDDIISAYNTWRNQNFEELAKERCRQDSTQEGEENFLREQRAVYEHMVYDTIDWHQEELYSEQKKKVLFASGHSQLKNIDSNIAAIEKKIEQWREDLKKDYTCDTSAKFSKVFHLIKAGFSIGRNKIVNQNQFINRNRY